MSSPDHRGAPLPLELAARISAVCQRFEWQWQTGAAPRLEEFLPLVDEADRGALLRELLELERHQRGRRGEHATKEEYHQRLPAYAGVIAAVFSAPTGSAGETQDDLPVKMSPASTVDADPWQTGAAASQPPAAAPAVSIPGYEILSVLGRGGMGVVYKAIHQKLNRQVAVKMILAGTDADLEDLIRFRMEAEAVARLQHPNIVQIHDVGEHQGRPFFTMELVDGGSLTKVLAGNPLPPALAAP
jgi:eukaryotic-like serine/threonine-protein kinase